MKLNVLQLARTGLVPLRESLRRGLRPTRRLLKSRGRSIEIAMEPLNLIFASRTSDGSPALLMSRISLFVKVVGFEGVSVAPVGNT